LALTGVAFAQSTNRAPIYDPTSPPQTRDKFVISAKAGGVNSVVGTVQVMRKGQTEEQLLTAQDDLEPGDIVTTGATARIEVLLNPGAYFRAAENAEFQFIDNSSENLRVKLTRGSAIIEATGQDDADLDISVITPQTRLLIVRRGIYRLNVGQTTELLVRKGRVEVDDGTGQVIKEGLAATFDGKTQSVAKLSKQQEDDFDSWSRSRGELVAQGNKHFPAPAFSSYLGSLDPWNFGFWDMFNGYGVWAYYPGFSCYTFLPLSYNWRSPYGRHYNGFYLSRGPGRMWRYHRPVNVVNSRTPTNTQTATGRTTFSTHRTPTTDNPVFRRLPSSSSPSFGPAREPSFGAETPGRTYNPPPPSSPPPAPPAPASSSGEFGKRHP
jgi:hypothetical protein